MTAIEITLRLAKAIGEVNAAAWDACANPRGDAGGNGAGTTTPPPLQPACHEPQAWPLSGELSTLKDSYNPFISHDFLSSLERCGSVRSRAGWTPMHLLAEEPGGGLVGAVPCYAKSHSQGEYVFDHGWADAYERAGGSYYPKLQVSVPFTPATGRRLLARPGAQADDIRQLLAEGLAEVCRRSHASSV